MPTPAKVMQHREPTSPKTSLTGDFADLLRTLMMPFDSYRPELHYLRGPGPKWHAKNDPAPASLDNTRGSRTQVNGGDALASFVRTGLDLLHRTPNHRFAKVKLRNWR
jgi:hypothetical protein